MRISRPRVTGRSRLRLRRTARLRFTLLSGVLFLSSGAALLAFTYLLFDRNSQVTGRAGGPGQPSAGGSLGVHHFLLPAAAAAAQAAADRHHLMINSAIALIVVGALALLLGWIFAGRMLRPVRTITATADRISASNLDQRLALGDSDEEFKHLGDTLDNLLARLQAAFDAQQHFVANASHELRTPLTAERALLQVALDDPDTTNEEWRSTARELLAANDEQEQLIEALLTLASGEAGLDHYEPLDLSVLADTALLNPGPETEERGIEVTAAMQPAPTSGHPALVERLIANLIDNAVRYNVPGGHVHLQTSTTADGHARLAVANTGPQIPATEIDRLFEPFQRLKTTRTNGQRGHGLGLSIVKAIAAAHHAQLRAEPRPDGGLEIQLSFPAANAATRNASHTEEARLPAGAREAPVAASHR
jgi:signal transduction histidine kinase